MGCVSSNLLSHEDEFTQLGSTALGHHIVSLTSSTYGLLTLDPPPSPQPPSSSSSSSNRPSPTTPPIRFTIGPTAPPEPKPARSAPEVINSWELMAGLDADSFRFSPIPVPVPVPKPPRPVLSSDKENSNPNHPAPLDRFARICPPGGDHRVVVYTTTLRGVRRTFEACNAVRAAIESFGVAICERDVSMDRGFREELRELMRDFDIIDNVVVPPQVFVKGRYVGGAEEVLRLAEDGGLGEILEGLPKRKSGSVCEGCGDVRFLPCFRCNGSCKMAVEIEEMGRTLVVKCPDCNENGLVLCPICS